MKENYKLIVAYDGSRYFGFEKQKEQEATIQGKLEGVFSRIPGNEQGVEIIGASRTDAGVHARGMCANVFLDTELSEEEIQDYGNRYLPEDIAIVSVRKVSPRFHARYNALGKIYRYSCYIGKTKPVFDRKILLHLEEEPDLEAMQEAAQFLIGKLDFKSFCGNPKMKKSTIRSISSIRIQKSQNLLRFYFEGSGFLQYQIRIMVGTLLEVGYHKRKAGDIPAIIDAKDRQKAGYTAPAKGLCLMKVLYD